MPPSDGTPKPYLHYIHDCMNGTVYSRLTANASACQAACTAAGADCAAFALPLGPGVEVCHLLKDPLVEWFGGATGHPCRCAVKQGGASHWEGPGENDVVRLKDGSLLTVFRVDSCHPYWHSRSTDGKVWSAPQPLAANVNGSARPKLLLMPNGQPLLAGGRPGLFLWLGDIAAKMWTPINVAAVHNSLTTDEPTWQYSSSFVSGGNVEGLPCETGNNVPRPAGSTSYTSLLQVGTDEFLLQYDRLANGWHFPPGAWGKTDHTFSMRFKFSAVPPHKTDDGDRVAKFTSARTFTRSTTWTPTRTSSRTSPAVSVRGTRAKLLTRLRELWEWRGERCS